MKLALCVFLGSGIGGVCRYLASGSTDRMIQNLCRDSKQLTTFPFATFVVNIAGCFLIGLIYGAINKGISMTPEMRIFLTAGFCGGLTTFSTFSHENYILFHGNHFGTFLVYALLSLAIGLLAAFAGHAIIK